MPSGVHDSALIVNVYRARRSEVSGDPFARLWVTPESERWADDYARRVGATEILVHALRHRFFLDALREFLAKRPDGVFVNIGAGFTHYPQLLPVAIHSIEVDTDANLAFKRERLAELEGTGQVPRRRMDFLSVADLNDPAAIDGLAEELGRRIGARPSFVLFEGVFFYLGTEAIARLFENLAGLQQPGDRVACTCFRPEEAAKAMYGRLVEYCRSDYRMAGFAPTALPASFYAHLSGYALRVQRNYHELAGLFGVADELNDREEVLEEDIYMLERVD